MSEVTFTSGDFDNLELVRTIVFQRLRSGRWNQLYDQWDQEPSGRFVKFDPPGARERFYVLMQEVMWQLITQNVITPGMNASNPALPWFRITDYGKTVISAERFLPHDPTGYLQEFDKEAISDVGKAARPYLEEALRCFTSGCHAAGLLMLGVGAEAVLLELCDVVLAALKNGTEQKKLSSFRFVGPKHKFVVDKVRNLPKAERQLLPESLDLTLGSLYDLIRSQRNDLGHPTGTLPKIDRERAFVYFRVFPPFLGDVEQLAEYCRHNQI